MLSYVYAVGNGQAMKIGKSSQPNARISDLGTASHIPLVTYYVGATNADAGAIERQAHAQLFGRRLNGEWFDVPPQTAIGAIETAAQALGMPIMRVDGPDGAIGPSGPLRELKGFHKIWAQPGAPFIHKLNMSALRCLGYVLSIAAMAAVGILIALTIQFVKN